MVRNWLTRSRRPGSLPGKLCLLQAGGPGERTVRFSPSLQAQEPGEPVLSLLVGVQQNVPAQQ